MCWTSFFAGRNFSLILFLNFVTYFGVDCVGMVKMNDLVFIAKDLSGFLFKN